MFRGFLEFLGTIYYCFPVKMLLLNAKPNPFLNLCK